MDPQTTPASRCRACQQPATLVCTGCRDAPVYERSNLNTYYCSSQCQMKDRSTHKNDCKRLQMRKLLFRAASLLQDIFYVYREAVFDKLIVDVQKRDGNIYLYEGHYDETPELLTVDDILFDFPAALVPDTQEKKAVLSYMSSADAVGWMQDLVHYVLKDICSHFEEFNFILKNPKSKVILLIGVLDVHNVLKVRLKGTNEFYILDFAGAQYGLFDPVHPAADYEQSYICTKTMKPATGPYGTTKSSMLTHAEDKSLPGAAIAISKITCGYLLKGAEDWEKKHSLTILELLRMKGKDKFEANRATLIDGIHSWIDSAVEALKEQAKETKEMLAAGSLGSDQK